MKAIHNEEEIRRNTRHLLWVSALNNLFVFDFAIEGIVYNHLGVRVAENHSSSGLDTPKAYGVSLLLPLPKVTSLRKVSTLNEAQTYVVATGESFSGMTMDRGFCPH